MRMIKYVVALAALGCASEVMDEDEVGTESAAVITPGSAAWVESARGGWFESTQFLYPRAYATGGFEDRLVLDGFTARFPDSEGHHAFVASYDEDGGLVWARAFQATGGMELSIQGATNGNGNDVLLLTARTASKSLDFGCGEAIEQPAQGHSILVALSLTGECLWTQDFPDDGQTRPTTLHAAIYRERIALAGSWTGQLALDGAKFTTAGYPERRNQEIFVAQLDLAGQVIWAKHGGARSSIADVTVDGNGNILLTGTFERTIDFGGGAMSAANGRVMVVKLRPSGSFVFARQFGRDAEPIAIATGPGGQFAVTGSFTAGTIDFGATRVSTSRRESDTWVVRYDAFGSDKWSRLFTGSAESIEPAGLAFNKHGDLAVSGNFSRGSLEIGSERATAIDSAGYLAVFTAPSGAIRYTRTIGGNQPRGARVGPVSYTNISRVLLGGQASAGVNPGRGALPPGATGFLAEYYR